MHSNGSSLIESLVAMSIFSIGSAATGAWFVQTLATDARVSHWLAAEAIAASMEARMRSNPVGMSGGVYAAAPEASSPEASDCVHACDAAALAADDVRRFREALTAHVGVAADGNVSCGSERTCVVRIRWQGREVLVWPFER
jgi:prepilin-type N-terminal cleavage/methylation domain-containing protein